MLASIESLVPGFTPAELLSLKQLAAGRINAAGPAPAAGVSDSAEIDRKELAARADVLAHEISEVLAENRAVERGLLAEVDDRRIPYIAAVAKLEAHLAAAAGLSIEKSAELSRIRRFLSKKADELVAVFDHKFEKEVERISEFVALARATYPKQLRRGADPFRQTPVQTTEEKAALASARAREDGLVALRKKLLAEALAGASLPELRSSFDKGFAELPVTLL
jgi:hypothetical protein